MATGSTQTAKDVERIAMENQDGSPNISSINKGEDILALQDIDKALNAKMYIVNNVRIIPMQQNLIPTLGYIASMCLMLWESLGASHV